MPDLPLFTATDIEAQQVLDVASFGNDDGVELGLVAVAVVRERGLSLAVRVELHGDVVFQAKLGATGPDNDAWLSGKAAVVHRFGVPSLLVRLRHDEAGTRFADRDDVDHERMRAAGGSVPIRVAGDPVGTLTVSGEPDVVDHATTVEVVRRFLDGR